MPKLVQEVEAFFAAAVSTIEADLEAGWVELKPAILAVGQTVLSQVETAVATYIAGGFKGKIKDVVASVTDQLRADASSVEVAVAGLIAAKIAAAKAVPPAA